MANAKYLFCLALILGSAMATLAQGEQPLLFRVIASPSSKTVHTHERFAIALRVENLTRTNHFLHMGSQDWQMDWKIDNLDLCLNYGPVPTANIPIDIDIPPGGEYTNEIGAFVYEPISPGRLLFAWALRHEMTNKHSGVTMCS